ncbi:type II secretion system protein GspM [Stutzerimonas stutzeri]|uniref:type II secretion system protein GspM n=1 Tax=Stutzerimonas stutzeri TaxID=316 RepID=UPI00210E321D|nr:type II secretion system protein GspM [Stutzerimonas stutzeri]MCQ4241901.1 type II secretion system protein GspM [Stutzerimonas stutzeri]
MNKLLQRWQALAPREQWLSLGVGLALLIMLYMLLLAEPLGLRIAAEQSRQQLAEARRIEAQNSLQDIRRRLAADPNLSYRQALKAAQASREELHQRIDVETSTLVSPEKMKALLQDLLRNQAKLKLVALQSSSAPLELPGAAPATQEQQASPVVFYRHGVQLTLEGGYFDLLTYLKAIEASGWRLHWDRLDYEVGENGHDRARVTLDLHTLSRDAGWVGV